MRGRRDKLHEGHGQKVKRASHLDSDIYEEKKREVGGGKNRYCLRGREVLTLVEAGISDAKGWGIGKEKDTLLA